MVDIEKIINELEMCSRAYFWVHYGRADYAIYDVHKGRFAFDIHRQYFEKGILKLQTTDPKEVIEYLQEKEVLAAHVLNFKEWSGL